MQRAKANAEASVPVFAVVVPFWVVVAAAVVATLATAGEPATPPQPVASSEHAASARTAARMTGGRHRMVFGSLLSIAKRSSPPEPERTAVLRERSLRSC
jgi:hypothetical protein